MKYNRSLTDLRKHAVMWWPEFIVNNNKLAAILPYLLKTQDQFISILTLADKSPEQVFSLLKTSEFPANLFLKHLAILADYGGEMMKRLGASFSDLFPKDDNGYYMDYYWSSNQYMYYFKTFGKKARTVIDNSRLYIDQDHILTNTPITDEIQDMIMILLYASTSSVAEQAGLSSCDVGNLLGNKEELSRYIKQRYIIVSKIISGCKANDQGQIAQTMVCNYLKEHLGEDYIVTRNGKLVIPGYEKEDGMPFDILVTRNNKHVGVEVSFQVTTNSTIERKSGQAANRQNLMHSSGNYIAYILDGAGNFQREAALSTICDFSDCTVAYSKEEFGVLVEWIKTVL